MSKYPFLIGLSAVVLLALVWVLTEWVWLGGLMVSLMFVAWILVKANAEDDNNEEDGWDLQ